MKTCYWCECLARHNIRFKDNSVGFFCDKHYDEIAKLIQKSYERKKFVKGSLHGQFGVAVMKELQ